MEQFLFPFGWIEKTDRVVIYGAGKVGKAFWYQMRSAGYGRAILWVDKNYKAYQEQGLQVSAPKILTETEYDRLVIAVVDIKVMYEIRKELLDMGVEAHKLVWSEHFRLEIPGQFPCRNAEEEYHALRDEDILQKVPALQMVSYKRLDILIRYLLCKDILNEVENEDNLKLYFRFFLIMNGAEEPMDMERIGYFSDYEQKCGLQEFLETFRALISSMRKNGFQKKAYIPIGADKLNINGSHRAAAALALEEEIWVREYGFTERIAGWDYQYFEKRGFSEQDKLRIMRAYADLYPECTILVLFANCEKEWEFIEKKISKNVRVVGKADLEFGDNLYGFYNLIREIFYQNCKEKDISDFVEELLFYRLHFRVFLISDDDMGGGAAVYSYVLEFVQSMNKWYGVSESNCDLAYMYAAKSKKQFLDLKEILLSENNILHENLRFHGNPGVDFDRKLKKLEDYMIAKKIEKGNICLTGKTVMELYGLGMAEKLEIWMDDGIDINEIIKDSPEDFIFCRNDRKNEDYTKFPDIHLLLRDNNFYFIYHGFKFMNLELVRTYMEHNKNRTGMKKECRVLQLFFDYQRSFPDTEELRKRFQKELLRQEEKLMGV